MDTVNIFAPELRNVIRKEVSFIEGAWVDFYDDMTAGTMLDAQEASKSQDVETNLKLVMNQIAGWNFADQSSNQLEVTLENLKRLPLKLLTWITTASGEILTSPEVEDKKKESPEILSQP